MVVNFVHKSIRSSGNHNVSCRFMNARRGKCNFKSILVKNFHDLNFNDWSKNSSPRNCCKDSGLRVLLENVCILDIMEQVTQNRRPRQVEFYASSRLIHDVQAKRLHSAMVLLGLRALKARRICDL